MKSSGKRKLKSTKSFSMLGDKCQTMKAKKMGGTLKSGKFVK